MRNIRNIKERSSSYECKIAQRRTEDKWKKDKNRKDFAGINVTSYFAVYSPYGGVKKSGFGKVLGKEGLLDVTYQKTTEVIKRQPPIVSPVLFPWTSVNCENLINFAKLLFLDGLKSKLSTLGKLLKGTMIHQKEYKEFIKE